MRASSFDVAEIRDAVAPTSAVVAAISVTVACCCFDVAAISVAELFTCTPDFCTCPMRRERSATSTLENTTAMSIASASAGMQRSRATWLVEPLIVDVAPTPCLRLSSNSESLSFTYSASGGRSCVRISMSLSTASATAARYAVAKRSRASRMARIELPVAVVDDRRAIRFVVRSMRS